MKNARRGQTAVEYLTTYGWAILLLVIVVGALFASGALNPSYFISEECYLGPNLPCVFQLYQTGPDVKMVVQLSNGFPYKIGINKFIISDSATGNVIKEIPTPGTNAGVLSSGETLNFTIPFQTGDATQNTMNRYKVEITYYSCAQEVNQDCKDPTDPQLVHTISGRIIGKLIVQ